MVDFFYPHELRQSEQKESPMAKDVYQKLRRHLDDLPGGYPTTESGVELRILRRLFSPEEAELAMKLTVIPEPGAVVARRAKKPLEELTPLLDEMARKGLIFRYEYKSQVMYMAAQYVIGIWEYHVNDLDPELIKDMNEYIPHLFKPEDWQKAPQLRTIPVGRSLTPEHEVLHYEAAEELVRTQKKFLVAPCICRKEQHIKGQMCGKPMEVCLVFGWGADYYQRNGLGRVITLEETLDILRRADQEGLVLQPSNTQDITNICCCCGDCCVSLRSLKLHPAPARICSTPFVVQAEADECDGCETCLERCQMEALSMEDDVVAVAAERCIGCGLCVSTCPSEALKLVRKPDYNDDVPINTMDAMQRRAQARALAKKELESKLERHQRI